MINRVYSIVPWWAIESWQSDFEDALNMMIRRNSLDKESEKIVASAYIPWKKTAITELTEKIKNSEDESRLAKEYQFLRSWAVVWYKPLDVEWIKSIKSSFVSEKPTRYYSVKELNDKLKPLKNEKRLLEIAPFIIFFKDYRDDVRRTHAFYWSFIFEVIAKRFDIGCDDIGYMTLDEIETLLNRKKIDRGMIKERKDKRVIITISKDFSGMVAIDKNIEKYEKIIDKIDEEEKSYVIKGLIAQSGKIIGPVKIIRSYHDLKHIEKGDILVSNTTHPDYLPAMQKAAAFVTNEGGVISHAAIVAREMKKPCIVGTKVATKVLKEGQIVEVDAEDGFVRVLK